MEPCKFGGIVLITLFLFSCAWAIYFTLMLDHPEDPVVKPLFQIEIQ